MTLNKLNSHTLWLSNLHLMCLHSKCIIKVYNFSQCYFSESLRSLTKIKARHSKYFENLSCKNLLFNFNNDFMNILTDSSNKLLLISNKWNSEANKFVHKYLMCYCVFFCCISWVFFCNGFSLCKKWVTCRSHRYIYRQCFCFF